MEVVGNNRILALDDATSITGYSVIEEGKLIEYGLLRSKGKDNNEKIHSMTKKIMNLIEKIKPNTIVLEDIYLNDKLPNNVDTFKKLSRLQGSLIYNLLENKCNFIFIYPSFWRGILKINGMNRAIVKAQAQKAVKNIFNIDVSEDEADAICIGFCSENIRQEDFKEKTTQWIM